MKKEELRIGNLLNYPKYHKDGTDKIWKVRDLFTDNYQIGLSDGIVQTKVNFDLLKPIQLTEEWLLKFGFIKVRYGKYAHEKIKQLRINSILFNNSVGLYLMGSISFDHIKYVHQLQNLYFALTGEELTLKK